MTAASSGAFRLAVSRALGTVVVTVHGALDGAGAGHLGSVLSDLIDGQGNLAVVVDLHDATAACTAAVAVLAAAGELAGGHGGALAVSDPPALLSQALQARGMRAVAPATLHRGRHWPVHRPLVGIAGHWERAFHPAGRAPVIDDEDARRDPP